MIDIESELRQGIERQQAGDMAQAVGHYKAVLSAEPNNVDALNLMSVVASSLGDFNTAASLAYTAIAEQGDWFLSHLNFGNALMGLGRPAEAVDAYQKAVTLNPQSPEAYVNLSDALVQSNRPAEAADMAVQAIIIKPEMADAHVNFGNALLALDSPGEAVEAYIRASMIDPENALAWMNLGNAYIKLGVIDPAVDAYRRAIALSDGPIKRLNLGSALYGAGRLAEAAQAYRDCLALDPKFLDAHINLGAVLRDMGALDEAEATVRAALALAPDEPELHWNLALVLLTKGDYSQGWQEYEWRWQTPHFARFVREFHQPEWQGEPLEGRSILIHAEQGYGDALEMARYIPLLFDKGAAVTLECRQGLGRLFSTLHPDLTVIEVGDGPLPRCDFHLPMMSLPLAFGTTLETIPAKVPYLSVPKGAASFADLADRPGPRIGAVWSGSAGRRDNQPRSFRPHDLMDLVDAPIYSLQKGDVAATASDLFDHGLMVDLGPRLEDFADTAAAIAAMDLIITADTAVAHLAGALGKPVWILLPYPSSAFLWMSQRTDTPWYPTARLFRQTSPGDWSGVIAEVHQALAPGLLA
ncbi:hypothetical protein A6A04_05860 [Paramagnetospirillum marisnigri]|uniref:Uncharacterized protein n=1 Tax=Paramagnetospirillum marisnigri TaxID=1285242 RepID=A0A178MDN9_9PROT|nr:tetratricopeptide repeat protein [Paramagnetospirillum marisnigri]OAN46636.1 hypothetical protein A6A04_05860 [Paramagnetospirillum marisnigri]